MGKITRSSSVLEEDLPQRKAAESRRLSGTELVETEDREEDVTWTMDTVVIKTNRMKGRRWERKEGAQMRYSARGWLSMFLWSPVHHTAARCCIQL
nr:hypothetical protein CFP56_57885 [Quercus suber]